LVGFMGKLFIFISAFQAGLYGLIAVAVIGVVISIYYYFGWIKAAFFETWATSPDAPVKPARTPVDLVTGIALGALALSTVVLGFYQGPLGAWLTPR
jgi:NADH-quinone oxidoreductase subunit N